MPSFSEGLMRGVQTSFAIMDRKRELAAQDEARNMRRQEFGQLVKLREQQIGAALLSNRSASQRISQAEELFPLQKRQAQLGISQTEKSISRSDELYPIQKETAELALESGKRKEAEGGELFEINKRQLLRSEDLQGESDTALDDFARLYKSTNRMKMAMESGVSDTEVSDEDMVIFANGLERLGGGSGNPITGVEIVPVEPQTAAGQQTGGYVPEMMVAAHLTRADGKNEFLQADPRMLMEQAMAMRSALMSAAVSQAKQGSGGLLEKLMSSEAEELPDRAAVVEYYRGRGFSDEEAHEKAMALYGHGPDSAGGAKDTVYLREVEYFKKELGIGTEAATKLVRKMRNKEADDVKLAIDLMKSTTGLRDINEALDMVKGARQRLAAEDNAGSATPSPGAAPAEEATYYGEPVGKVGKTSLPNWKRQRDRKMSKTIRSSKRVDERRFPNALKWADKDTLGGEFPDTEWLVAKSKNDYVVIVNKQTGQISVPQTAGR